MLKILFHLMFQVNFVATVFLLGLSWMCMRPILWVWAKPHILYNILYCIVYVGKTLYFNEWNSMHLLVLMNALHKHTSVVTVVAVVGYITFQDGDCSDNYRGC